MSKPKLALIPSGYKSGKVYSILPNDASGDFDFTRQSIGTRVRKDGLIEEAKTVGSITNELLYSEEFEGTNWGTINTTITSNQELAPNGTNTADKLQRTSTSASYRQHSISKSSTAKKYTTSVYLKKGSHDYFALRTQGSYPSRIDIRFRFDTEQIYYATAVSNFTLYDYGVEVLANDWYRLHYTYETDTHNNINVSFSPRHSNGNIDSSDSGSTAHAFVWGAMVSEGALSDYIKTEGSSETKTVETFTDVPRLDWLNSNCPSLLLEPQRTNLQVYSEQFDNSAWSKSNSSIDANSIVSPNGELTADKLIENTANSTHKISDTITSASNDVYTFSIFAKGNGRDFFHLGMSDAVTGQANILVNIANGTIDNGTIPSGSWTNVSGSIENYGNGWYKVSVTGQKNSGTQLQPNIEFYNGNRTYTGDGVSGIYIFGAQVEQGSYPTSYIKTEASAVTRLKDECLNGGDSDLFDITEGTFFVDAYAPNSTNSTIISLSNGTDAQKITLLFEAVFSRVRTYSSGGVLYYDNLSYNQRNKILITFKLNEYKTYINGSLVSTYTSATVPSGMDRLNFSNKTNTANHFEGKVYDARVYDRVLTEAEAIEITTL